MTKLPAITHLQLLILSQIKRRRISRISGAEIRDEIELLSPKHSRPGPGFYQLMGRMEKAHLIGGEYREFRFKGQRIRERCYFLLPAGRKALKEAKKFYADL